MMGMVFGERVEEEMLLGRLNVLTGAESVCDSRISKIGAHPTESVIVCEISPD